jgi:hypothetical protein
MPALQSAREADRCTQCRSNLKQIGIGVLHYYDANKGHFFLHHPFLADSVRNSQTPIHSPRSIGRTR